jgi:hypothetical protein
MQELTLDQVKSELAGVPLQKGGCPDWMFNDWFAPELHTMQIHLDVIGVKITFVRNEDKGGEQHATTK